MKVFYRRNLPHWQPPGASIFITWRLYGSLPESALRQLEATRELLSRELAKAGESDREFKLRQHKKWFAAFDALLDKAESGPLWLKDEKVASIVEEALLERYQAMYSLWAYVVMANHVHVLLQPKVAQTSVCADSVRHSNSNATPLPEAQTEVCASTGPSFGDDAMPLPEAQTEVCATSEPETSNSDNTYIPLNKITKSLKGYTAREANKVLGRVGRTFWQEESFDHWVRHEAELNRIIAYIENNPVKAGLVSRPEDWPWSSAAKNPSRPQVNRPRS